MTAAGLACATCGTGLSENVEAVKSTVPQQMRGEIIPKLEQPEEHRASDVHTKSPPTKQMTSTIPPSSLR
jgi:hypothetical protein